MVLPRRLFLNRDFMVSRAGCFNLILMIIAYCMQHPLISSSAAKKRGCAHRFSLKGVTSLNWLEMAHFKAFLLAGVFLRKEGKRP